MRARAEVGGFALLGGCALSSGLLSWLAWPSGTGWADLMSSPAEQTLPLLLALAMSAVSAWVAVLVMVGLAARVPGSIGQVARVAFRHLAPAVLRRVVEAMLGATTVLAVTAGAAQAAQPVQRPVTAAAVQTVLVPKVASLDRPAAPTQSVHPPDVDLDRPAGDPSRGIGLVTSAPTRSPAAQAKSATITVRAGDSLWRIAARSLPRGATPQAIEHAWHRWYAANRGVIGPDPGLLHPGQQLIPPQS